MFVRSDRKIVRFINIKDGENQDNANIEISSEFNCIGKRAFKDERIIETVSITADTNDFTIEESAFENCPALRSVNIKSENSLDLNIQARAFRNCHELVDVVIKIGNESKVIIETGAFDGCCNLRTLYIGSDGVAPNLSDFDVANGAFTGVDKSKFTIVVRVEDSEVVERFARENEIICSKVSV